jgi:hypothetical protein
VGRRRHSDVIALLERAKKIALANATRTGQDEHSASLRQQRVYKLNPIEPWTSARQTTFERFHAAGRGGTCRHVHQTRQHPLRIDRYMVGIVSDTLLGGATTAYGARLIALIERCPSDYVARVAATVEHLNIRSRPVHGVATCS